MPKEKDELLASPSLKALGDVGGNRQAGTPHLIPHGKVSGEIPDHGDLIDASDKLPGFLPGENVFELSKGGHFLRIPNFKPSTLNL